MHDCYEVIILVKKFFEKFMIDTFWYVFWNILE